MGWVVSLMHLPLCPGKEPAVLIKLAADLLWTFWGREISCPCQSLKPESPSPYFSNYIKYAVTATVEVHSLVTKSPAGGELFQRPVGFTAGGITPDVHCGDCVGPRTNLDALQEIKVSVTVGNRTPLTLSCSPQSSS